MVIAGLLVARSACLHAVRAPAQLMVMREIQSGEPGYKRQRAKQWLGGLVGRKPAAEDAAEDTPPPAEDAPPPPTLRMPGLSFAGQPATDRELRLIQAVGDSLADGDGWLSSLMPADKLRFVRACANEQPKATDEDVTAAALDRLQATAAWRREEHVDGILEREPDLRIERFFEAHKPGEDKRVEAVWLPGRDHLGRRTACFFADRHIPGELETSLWRRFVVYNAEHAIETLGVARAPGGQFSLVVDRSSSGRRNQDPKLALAVLPELMEHYPELLGNVYVAPVNSLFFAVWRVIKIFLAAETKRKFVLIPAGPRWREELRERVGDDVELPAQLLAASTRTDESVVVERRPNGKKPLSRVD